MKVLLLALLFLIATTVSLELPDEDDRVHLPTEEEEEAGEVALATTKKVESPVTLSEEEEDEKTETWPGETEEEVFLTLEQMFDRLPPDHFESDWFTEHLKKFRNYTEEMHLAYDFYRSVVNEYRRSIFTLKKFDSFRRSVSFVRNLYEYIKDNMDSDTTSHLRTFIRIVNAFLSDTKKYEKDAIVEKVRRTNWTHVIYFFDELYTSNFDSDSALMEHFLNAAEWIQSLSDVQFDFLLDTLRTMENMDEVTMEHIFGLWRRDKCTSIRELADSKQKQQVERVKNNMKELKTNLKCKRTDPALQSLISDIKSLEFSFFTNETKEIQKTISRHHFEMDRVRDLLAAGCGDLHLHTSSVLAKFSEIVNSPSRFTNVVDEYFSSNPTDVDVHLSNADFDSIYKIHTKYEGLSSEQQELLKQYLTINRMYAPLVYLLKMKDDGQMVSVFPTVNKIGECTNRKLFDVLKVVGVWKKGIDTKEAIDGLKALFEASKCDMLHQLGNDKQKKAVEQVVEILEDSFGLVSCRKNTGNASNSVTIGPNVATQTLIENLKKQGTINEIGVILKPLNHWAPENLKEAQLLSEGCLALEGHTEELYGIMSKMPAAVHFNNSKGFLPGQSRAAERTFDLYQEYDKLTPSEQSQLIEYLVKNGMEHQKELVENLVVLRHTLLDLKLSLAYLAACPKIDAFIDVVKLWNENVATPEAGERVMRMLEVSDCAMVADVASGGQDMDKLVKLLDEHFGTKSCFVKMYQAK